MCSSTYFGSQDCDFEMEALVEMNFTLSCRSSYVTNAHKWMYAPKVLLHTLTFDLSFPFFPPTEILLIYIINM